MSGAWTQLFPADSPSARDGAAIALYEGRDEVILFGGRSGLPFTYSAETWKWDGTDWTLLSTGTSPSARTNCGISYDPATDSLILFGGFNGGFLTDTWSFDGTTWTELFPADNPLRGYWLTHDKANGNVVAWDGGLGATDGPPYTWIWDGTDWVQQSPVHEPVFRSTPYLAYIDSVGAVVLFGGSNLPTYYTDTWIWDGTDWTELTPADNPVEMNGGGFAYCPSCDDGVLACGLNNNSGLYLGLTYSWDGTDWATEATLPTGRESSPSLLVSNVDASSVLLFGGLTFGSTLLGDTWIFSCAPPTPTSSPILNAEFAR